MARALYGIGRWIARHHLATLAIWALALVGTLVAVSAFGAVTNNNLSLPGTGSQNATNLLAQEFPPQQNGANPIVFDDPATPLTNATQTAAINQAVADLGRLPDVYSVVGPFSQQGAAQLSKDGHIAFASVLMKLSNAQVTTADARQVLDTAQGATRSAGIQVSAGGNIGSVLSQPKTEASEVVGIVAAMIILSISFGTLVAMGMPIATAILGLVVGLSIIGLIGHLVPVPSIGPTVATMIGLGVGVDYALFLVHRFRGFLHDGHETDEAVALSVATAGTAIVFAGVTVIIALLCLSVAGIPLVSAMGYSSAVAVLTAILGSITLLPALLVLVGPHIERLKVPAFLHKPPREDGGGFWERWAAWITGHPWWTLAIAGAVFAILIIPFPSLILGQEDIGATPTSTTERVAYDNLTAGFGVGYNGPLLIADAITPPAVADPKVIAQENELKQLQAELESEQAQGQAQQASLTAQAAQLEAQQAALQSQAAALQSQANYLDYEKAQLEYQRAYLRAQAAQLRRQAQQLLAQVPISSARVAALLAAAQALQDAVAENQATIAQIREELATTGDQARRRELLKEIARYEAIVHQDEIAAAKARAQARAHSASALIAQATSLARQARVLAAQAAALPAEAAALARQAAALEYQKAVLEQQAAALQSQANSLEAQKAQLEELQKTAAAQQAQAQQLQAELTAELTPAGGNPLGTDPRLVALQNALKGTSGVQAVSPPQINTTGTAVTYTAVPTTAPSAVATAQLVGTLRDSVIPQAVAGTGQTVYVGGTTAGNVDLAALISSKLPLVILVVLGLSIVVLLLAFNALAVALQAAVVNLICVAAVFGVMVAAFQWGWGISLLHIDVSGNTVPIASYVPLLMFAVLFGLSMDYQIFLLSQIGRHRVAGADDREATRSGLAAAARVVSTAALIMIAVFGSFIINGDPIVKQFGVGLTVAVLLAASAVLTVVPAVFAILGRWGWWMPRYLKPFIPHIDVEGASLPMDAPALDVEAAAGKIAG